MNVFYVPRDIRSICDECGERTFITCRRPSFYQEREGKGADPNYLDWICPYCKEKLNNA